MFTVFRFPEGNINVKRQLIESDVWSLVTLLSLIFAELNLAEFIFADFIFAVFGLFREIKFRETFNKDVIRENKFREISRIWKQ